MLTRKQVAHAFVEVCRLDVEAFKPGNVSIISHGHGMRAQDFLRSADVAGPCIAQPDLAVGERILQATKASWAAVGCNTNLGIVLLCAPLACALGSTLQSVLRNLTRDDAAQAFEAIRIASPGGLGEAPEHDVHNVNNLPLAPTTTLLAAMRAAAHRDRIALQYACDFEDIFSTGVPAARRFLAFGWSPAWAMIGVFLAFLSRFHDSHIERKFGSEQARSVTQKASELAHLLEDLRNPEEAMPALARWDRELKERGINPGTSADLAVASWFVLALEDLLKKG